MRENEESVLNNSNIFIKRKKKFFIKRMRDIRETWKNILKIYEKSKNDDKLQKTAVMNKEMNDSLKDNISSYQTNIILTTLNRRNLQINRKTTNFNSIFSKKTFSNNKEKSENNTLDEFSTQKNMSKSSHNKVLKHNIAKTILYDYNSPIKIILKAFDLNSNLSKFELSLPRTRNNYQQVNSDVDINGINILNSNYYKKDQNLSKEKIRCSLLNSINIDRDNTTSSNNFLKYVNGANKGLNNVFVNTFIPSNSVNQKTQNCEKYNYIDCLVVDKLSRMTTVESRNPPKINICSFLVNERAKHIYQNLVLKKKDNVTLLDNSLEIQNRNKKFLDERKKRLIVKKSKHSIRVIAKKLYNINNFNGFLI